MTTYMIDLTQVHSYYGLREYLIEALPLPDYYGRNMDALWDSLHCWVEEPAVTIEGTGAEGVSQDLKETILRRVLDRLHEMDGINIIYR